MHVDHHGQRNDASAGLPTLGNVKNAWRDVDQDSDYNDSNNLYSTHPLFISQLKLLLIMQQMF